MEYINLIIIFVCAALKLAFDALKVDYVVERRYLGIFASNFLYTFIWLYALSLVVINQTLLPAVVCAVGAGFGSVVAIWIKAR